MDRNAAVRKYTDLLHQCVLFRDMPETRLFDAMQLFRAEYKTYQKGMFLHHAGEPLRKFGFVLSGAVQAMTDDPDGNRMIMANVIPGGTFGESLCYLKIKDSPTYIRASENTEILWLSLSELYGEPAPQDALARDLRRRFTAMLAARALTMNQRIQVLSNITIRDKLITFFTHAAARAGSRSFTISMTRDDLAAYIGANRSAMSRELSKMRNEGLIEFRRNRFRIIKFEKNS